MTLIAPDTLAQFKAAKAAGALPVPTPTVPAPQFHLSAARVLRRGEVITQRARRARDGTQYGADLTYRVMDTLFGAIMETSTLSDDAAERELTRRLTALHLGLYEYMTGWAQSLTRIALDDTAAQHTLEADMTTQGLDAAQQDAHAARREAEDARRALTEARSAHAVEVARLQAQLSQMRNAVAAEARAGNERARQLERDKAEAQRVAAANAADFQRPLPLPQTATDRASLTAYLRGVLARPDLKQDDLPTCLSADALWAWAVLYPDQPARLRHVLAHLKGDA